MKDKFLLFRSTHNFEVEVIKLKLDEAKIPNWVMNKQDSSYLTFGDIELYVNAEDKEEAQKLTVSA